MAALFRSPLGQWVAHRDDARWVRLFNASVLHPLQYLHPGAWSPLCGATRRYLLQPPRSSALAAQHLWSGLASRRGEMLPPLDAALEQSMLWRLVMCLTRRELLTLALWCGASVMRRRVAAAVDRASSARWRARLGQPVYADVLQSTGELAACLPMPPAPELISGRLLLDVGLTLVADWSADPQGWARRRIEAAAGPHSRRAEHYVGPGALQPVEAVSAQAAMLSFVGRHSHEQ